MMRIILLLAILTIGLSSCNPDDESPSIMMTDDDQSGVSPLPIDSIQGCFYLRDNNGAAIGTLGDDCQGIQWTNYPLNDYEKDLLNFDLQSSEYKEGMADLKITDLSMYPIPINSQGEFALYIIGENTSLAVGKFVVVDENAEVVRTFDIPTTVPSIINFSLEGVVSHKKPYRLYYEFSSAPETVFYTGFGNFYVCDDSVNYLDCLD